VNTYWGRPRYGIHFHLFPSPPRFGERGHTAACGATYAWIKETAVSPPLRDIAKCTRCLAIDRGGEGCTVRELRQIGTADVPGEEA
jgi:hypothetical protein